MFTSIGVNIYDSDVSSFAFNGTMDYAKNFAQIPVNCFVDLVDGQLRRLKSEANANFAPKRVIVIGCHPRCGGTLLTQLFESDELLKKNGVVIINEPHVFHRLVNVL